MVGVIDSYLNLCYITGTTLYFLFDPHNFEI